MANPVSLKLRELKRIVRLHANWLIYATLGESALTVSEVEELKEFGKLPMDKELDFVGKSYALGHIKALSKRSEYKETTLNSLKEKPNDATVEQLRFKAAQNIRSFTNKILDPLEEALARAVVAQHTEEAVEANKTASQLASTLASKLSSAYKADWKRIAETELHASKVSGFAQTIISKKGIYANSDGIDSQVSVVPGSRCCADCKHVYLDGSGNPQVFNLRSLVSAGSNADEGVVHSKVNGIHTHWKVTLPPLHPGCGCQVVYVAPGYGWENGKLGLLNKSMFEAHLAKSASGVAGGIATKVESKGPKANQTPNPAKAPGMHGVVGGEAPKGIPSSPGVQGSSKAGPGRPVSDPTKKDSSKTKTAADEPVACPLGADCPDGGQHHANSKEYQKHRQQAMAEGRIKPTEEDIEEHDKAQEEMSKQWSAKLHKDSEVLDHISNGKVSAIKPVGGDSVNKPFKITIEGNGSACMKAPYNLEGIHEMIPTDFSALPKKNGADVHSEVGAYQLSNALGLSHVPPTALRNHTSTGREHKDKHDNVLREPSGMTSVQSWQEGYSSMDKINIAETIKSVHETLGKSAGHKLANNICEIGVMDVIMNNGDRHKGNLMYKMPAKAEEGQEQEAPSVKAIDNGAAFGAGMQNHKNVIAFALSNSDKPFGMPSHMKQKIDSMSLGDFKRAHEGSHLEDYQVLQTFLRARYASHLQDRHGHIPTDYLKNVYGNADGDMILGRQGLGCKGDNLMSLTQEVLDAKDKGELPEQKFDSFAKSWTEKVAKDPSHPDHKAALEIMEKKPLVKRGATKDLDTYFSKRADLDQDQFNNEDHWDSVKSNWDFDFKDPKKDEMGSKLRRFLGEEAEPAPARVPVPIPGIVSAKKPSKQMELDDPFGAEVNASPKKVVVGNKDVGEHHSTEAPKVVVGNKDVGEHHTTASPAQDEAKTKAPIKKKSVTKSLTLRDLDSEFPDLTGITLDGKVVS